MGGKTLVDEYLESARQCEALAVKASSEGSRQSFLEIASTWRRIADLEAKADAVLKGNRASKD